MIRLSLPFPPSVNALYANSRPKPAGSKGKRRGRHKTAEYAAWIDRASIAIKDSHRQGIRAYSIAICLKRPDRRRRDIANLEKAVSDLLVAHGVIADDSGCERLTMSWDHGMKEECVVIVQPALEALAA